MNREPQISRAATALAEQIIDLDLMTADGRITPDEFPRLLGVLRTLRAVLRGLEGLELAILVARQALGAVGVRAPDPGLRARLRAWEAQQPCPATKRAT